MTKWSKFDTEWEGVTVDDLLAAAGVAPPTPFLLARSYDDYDTNVPFADLVGGRAMIATRFDGAPICPPSTVDRPGCSCRICTSGRARSG